MNKSEKNRVLVLSPHTDDGEIGCGATIAKFIEEGRDVHYLGFSACEESVPDGFPRDILRQEVMAATEVLGIPPDNVSVLDFSVRKFSDRRQDILEHMVAVSRELDPDLVIMPSSFDVHQDHATIFQEGRRAFKSRSILGYEFVWNSYKLETNMYIGLEQHHIEKKISAIAEYKSQVSRLYCQDEIVRGQARLRGLQVSKEFAEAFEVIRWVI